MATAGPDAAGDDDGFVHAVGITVIDHAIMIGDVIVKL